MALPIVVILLDDNIKFWTFAFCHWLEFSCASLSWDMCVHVPSITRRFPFGPFTQEYPKVLGAIIEDILPYKRTIAAQPISG